MSRKWWADNYKARECPNQSAHTDCPEGYLDWHSWAERMSKTHRQVRCPDCGLFSIWEPKQKLIVLPVVRIER